MDAHKRGDTWITYWKLTDSEGVPIDLTGASARLHLRDETRRLAVAATEANGRIIIHPLEGEIYLRVEATDMSALRIEDHYYDLELTWSDGTVETIDDDVLPISEDYTHD